ncbi:hypothetical protein [Streptomyces sp. NPDC048516]|uniref:hypothetical protein n=1 Tax=Streptomyces sp. NPDC048516 TaxID=3365565 RepID=UPI00370F7DD0
MKIFGREPALILSFIAILVKVVSAFALEVTADQQAWINAVAAAAVGLILAVMAHDAIGAAVLGFVQAVVALAVGFGLDWSADKQAVFMSLAAALVAMFDRTQVTAPVSAAEVRPATTVRSV